MRTQLSKAGPAGWIQYLGEICGGSNSLSVDAIHVPREIGSTTSSHQRGLARSRRGAMSGCSLSPSDVDHVAEEIHSPTKTSCARNIDKWYVLPGPRTRSIGLTTLHRAGIR